MASTTPGAQGADHHDEHAERASSGRPATPLTRAEAAEIITSALVAGHRASLAIEYGQMDGRPFFRFSDCHVVDGILVPEK